MVFFQTEENEYSTDLVVQYFRYLGGADFLRHDDANLVEDFTLEMTNEADQFKFSDGQINYELDEALKIFYRRGSFKFNKNFVQLEYEHKDVKQFVSNELIALRNYASMSLHGKPGGYGSHYEEISTNKLQQLAASRDAGLSIPETLVTNKKSQLNSFFEKHGSLIYKPITNHFTVRTDNIYIAPQGTKLVSPEFLSGLSDEFFPTLFQQVVDKKIEIRAFYFNDEFYSAAIFSQRNEKTSLDFRNYDREHANRLVPFIIPQDVEAKLRAVYKSLQLSTGSADLILTNEGDYVFLEINALGQFAWVSEVCNYNIEKKMAEYLCA